MTKQTPNTGRAGQKIPAIFYSLLVLTAPLSAIAMVNVRDASYVYQVKDVDLTQINDNLKIERHYSSRSRHSGMFGFGWCTNFEARLRILNEDSAALDLCGQGGARLFRRNPRTLQWKLDNGGHHERLIATGPFLINYIDGRPKYVFSRTTGLLISVIDSKNRPLGLNYDRLGRLRTVEAAGRARLSFDYSGEAKRIDRIRAYENQEINFDFFHADLVRVRFAGGELFSYQYDNFHNLVEIGDSRRVLQRIHYDNILDRVLSVQDGIGCEQSFRYNRDAEHPDLHTFTDSVTTCPDRVALQSRYDFWYSPISSSATQNKIGARYLSTFTVVNEREKKTMNFLPGGELAGEIVDDVNKAPQALPQ